MAQDRALYFAWRDMCRRCNNPNHKQYADWGGRGITLCRRWHQFELFAEDMEPHPGKGWSLDRINNDGNYDKENCRWANRTQQNRNHRKVKLSVEKAEEIRRRYIRGRPHHAGNAVALSHEFGVHFSTISFVGCGKSWTGGNQ